MSTATVRRASVKSAIVLACFAAGRAAGLKNGEMAESIGMDEKSFGVRVSQLRKKFRDDAALKAAQGTPVVNPFDAIDALARSRTSSKVNVFDNADLLASLDVVDATPETTGEATTEVPAA